MTRSDLAPACQPPARSFWERMTVGWHAVFLGLVLLCAVLVGVNGDMPARDRLWTEALLVGLGGWYLAVGRRALGRDDPRLGIVYLVGLAAATYTLISIDQAGYMLLFGVFPQIWAMLERLRDALAASAVFAAGIMVVTAGVAGWSASGWLSAGVTAAVSMVISALMGMWISGIIAESHQRAGLIEELRDTQDELASVSHEAGVLAERERLAAEIHDTLAQGFTSVLMLLQAAEADVERDPARARRHLALAQQAARENLAEARALVAALVPPALDGGLPAALRRLAHRFGLELAISSTVDVRGVVRSLPAACEVVLLRAAQEALANVRKHAGASSVAVVLAYSESTVELSVRDDGQGFDPDALPGSGFGLSGMRGRLRQVGGQLVVHSGLSGGTTVVVSVPS